MENKKGNYSDMYDAYLAGHTLVCHLVPSFDGQLAQLMRSITGQLGVPCMANMYLSPHSSRGFGPHTDATTGLIVQLAGSKKWIVRSSQWKLPTRKQLVGRPWEPNPEGVAAHTLF